MMIVVFGLAALLTFLIGLYFVLVHLGKTVLPDAIARYLTLHTHYSAQPDGFEVAIGLKHQVHASTLQITKQRELRMKYTIPASLCDKGGQMHVGGFMALADSVTSILVVCFDPQKRPGVSVVLTGELIGTKSGEHAKFTTSGTDIWIVASVEKIGLNISFTKCAFYASAQPGYELDMSTATLLAVVSHVKYINMGFLWNSFGKAIPGVFVLLRKLGLVKVDVNLLRGTATVAPSLAEGAAKEKPLVRLLDEIMELTADPASASKTAFLMPVTASIKNFFGATHGGALAIGAQRSIALAVPPCPSAVRSMSVRYLSPAKDVLAFAVDPNSSYIQVFNAKTSSMVASASFRTY